MRRLESTLLELIDITKYFPGVLALNHVNFDIKAGEVHVLMGENGAGKSTLMKIIDGIYQPDEGIIKINGQEKKITSPFYAIENGIAMIHQELNTVLDLSVAENIFLGREYGKGIFYNRKLMIKEAGKALNQLGIQIDPKQKMRELSVAKRQMVEIAKAVTTNAKVLIMDEPTSAISDTEVDALFKIIDDLKKKNVGIVYISHKMDEIFRIADRITVLRDGKTVGTYAAKDISVDQLITQMVGRNIKNIYPPRIDHEIGDEILKIRNISSGNVLKKISFSVHQGEIVGLAGLMGSGRSELAEVIFGLRTHEEGEIIIHGQKIKITKPLEAIMAGIAFITEDRSLTGLNKKTSVKKDMSIVTLKEYCMLKNVIQFDKENKAVDQQINMLGIKTPNRNQNIGNLSGGNQQKIIIARWLLSNPDILIMDEPTKGIDVGAKFEIYSLIHKLANQGKAILMISSELPEILGVCDRVLVMNNGELRGELSAEEMTQEAIMTLATGMEENCENRSK